MINKPIPEIVVGRLPQYLRSLQRMAREGRQVTSSQELGERLGISAAQIRKDLSQFGEFGKQGTGYNIPFLIEQIQKILHIHHDWDIAVVGAGDIGSAVARYKGFTDRGFMSGSSLTTIPLRSVRRWESLWCTTMRKSSKLSDNRHPGCYDRRTRLVRQEVADRLVEAGVKAILSYAPISLNVPQGVRVQYIDPSLHLQRMTYYLC